MAKARQQYFADEVTLQKENRDFSIQPELVEKLEGIEAGAQVNVIETVKVNGTALVPDQDKAVDVGVPLVDDTLYSTSSEDALSARQGRILYDYIQNIQSRGRYLSNWNCATGLAMTNPSDNPYNYRAGDYYIVSNVASAGGTNYRPDGSQYIINQASTTVETETVKVSDSYIYDGTNWVLLVNTEREIAVDSSLSTTSTNPVENRVVTNAINTKQDKLIAGTNIQIAADGKTISATDTTYSSLPAASGGTDVSLVTTGEKYTWNGKQDELIAGANISIAADGKTISAVDTTYASLPAAQGGTNVSLVTTGEKYTWDNKQDTIIGGTNVTISNDGRTINAVDTTYSAGTNVQIDANNVISATDTTYTAGANISIDANNEISAVDTTYSSLPAASGGTDVSLVTTGEKYTWNNKQDELTAGENVTIGQVCVTESDMRGPAPAEFHVPLETEWESVKTIWTTLGGGGSDGTNFGIAFKLPFAGWRVHSDTSTDASNQGDLGGYWSSTCYWAHSAKGLRFTASSIEGSSLYTRSDGLVIRCFKNTPVVPTSSWTKLYGTSIEVGGIFWSSADGLISLSSDGTTWITIADKNLGATQVWNSGDILSEANCGKYFQRGNNYGFPWSGTLTNTSSTLVDTSNYGPGNYYSSSTYIQNSIDWLTKNNFNLRGGQTQGTSQDCALTISATDTTYVAGDFDIKDLADGTGLRTTWSGKQDTLIAGTNIQIAADGKTISATDTTYTAGPGISISNNNVISNTQTSAEWGNITGTLSSQTDLQSALDDKQDELTAGDNVTIEQVCVNRSDMQGPAPSGFHVPLNTEWQAVYNIWTSLGGGANDGTNFGIALKLPLAGRRSSSSAGVDSQGSNGYYWSSSRYNTKFAHNLYFSSSGLIPQSIDNRASGLSVRCFKDTPTIPTSSWTKLYGTSIEAGGIFWSSTDGLISLSSDGQTWVTIADKNLGATTLWNSGDTLSEANCGKYYQWGNNYGFPRTGTIAHQSTTQVDASNYGPGNYYSSDTYIKYGGRWDTTDNGNLWGGETQGTSQDCALTISATDTTYTAGTGISIDANNVISNTQTSAEWGNITGTLSDQTDLNTALSGKQDTIIAGTNITIAADGKTISATDTTYTAGTGINIDANNEISNTGVLSVNGQTGNVTITIPDDSNVKVFKLPSGTPGLPNSGWVVDQDTIDILNDMVDYLKDNEGDIPILSYEGAVNNPLYCTHFYYDDSNNQGDFILYSLPNSNSNDLGRAYSIGYDISGATGHYQFSVSSQSFKNYTIVPSGGIVDNQAQLSVDTSIISTKQYVDDKTPIISATAPSSPTEGMIWYDTTNDVLKTYNGTSWETAGTQMVVLSYGHSTWQDFLDAYNKNAIVYCRASSNANPGSGNQGRMAFMAFIDINSSTQAIQGVEFQYYRSRSDHNSAANQLDQVFVYKLTPSSGGTWTVTERNTGAKAVAGTGINLAFGSGNMTISNTGVTSFNGDTGAITLTPGTYISLNNNVIDVDTSLIATKSDLANFAGFLVVAQLPTTDIKTNIIYLLGPVGSGADKYEEYIYSNNTWIKIGDTSIDLSPYFHKTNDDSDDIIEGSTHLFLTSAERTILGNTSGTNTGDETKTTIQTKLGAATSSNSGYLTSTDWDTFNGKLSNPSGGNVGDVLKKTANGVEWGTGGGGIVCDPNSPITVTKIWAGTQSQYEALSSYDENTVYMTI